MRLLRYPKTYATVVARDDRRFTLDVVTDGGATATVNLRQRGGVGPSASFVPGVRVKLYRRPGDRQWRFRKIGS